jgi:hypothetical protein
MCGVPSPPSRDIDIVIPMLPASVAIRAQSDQIVAAETPTDTSVSIVA